MANVTFHYQDNQGAPLDRVKLDAASLNGDWHGFTDGGGNFNAGLAPGLYEITASKPGYQTDVLQARIGGDGTITRALQAATSSIHLEIRGRYFVNPDGSRKVLNGCDMFLAYRQFLDGVNLAPFFEESQELGFNMWRVFMQGSVAQNNVLQLSPTEQGYYDHVRPFADLCNANGIILLATIGVDNQDIKSPIAHWGRMGQLLAGSGSIVSFYNEVSKNHGSEDPGSIPALQGVLWSRGSDVGDALPPKPQGPVLEFHPVRNYETAMRDAVASAIEIYEVQRYTGPLIVDEPGRMGTNAHDARFTDPAEVQGYARLLSTLCAGLVMHNFFGQRGRLMDAPTRDCGKAWTKGTHLS